MASVLEELSAAISAVSEAVASSVVGVGRGGSGAVVGDGVVVTNAHNLRSEAVTVSFPDGRRVDGTATGVDGDGDLAVITVDTGDAPPLQLADAGPRSGEVVVAFANPAGAGVRGSLGMVSAVDVSFRGPNGRMVTGAFEHTAPLARGSSGGPVVDSSGRVRGIDTHRVGDGFYLAVSAGAELRARLDALAAGQAPHRPRLGIAVAPPHVAQQLRRSVGLPERPGLLVHAVNAEGPAAAAGIGQGDLIVRVAGIDVADVDQLARALEATQPAVPVAVDLVRGADEMTVTVLFPAS
ncbi:MAG TPA: S1C family serine protease [Acidimicrobiales bacterium]|nr:S1C family serine protease [Acidimicrobiales bacterium]